MKLKKILIILLAGVVIFGCSKKIEEKKLKLKYAFAAEDMTNNNAIYSAGIYKDLIYYVQEYQDEFVIRFVSFDGKEKRKIKISRGKGPGEVMQSLGLKIINNEIYFADNGMQRITMLDMDGNYIDDMNYDKNTGFIFSFDLFRKNFYYHSMNMVYFGKIDENGKSHVYKKHHLKTTPEDKEAVDGCVIKIDKENEKIYASHIDPPYRIDIYDLKFNKLDEITYDLKQKIIPANWLVIRGHQSVRGDILASSMKLTDNYIFTTLNGGRMSREMGNSLEESKPVILKFDKKEKKCIKKLSFEKMNNIKGLFSIIGITDKYVVLHLLDISDNFHKLINNDDYKNGGQAILVYER